MTIGYVAVIGDGGIRLLAHCLPSFASQTVERHGLFPRSTPHKTRLPKTFCPATAAVVIFQKIEVIRRHIDFAIRSLFSGEDALQIITVASAAFQIAGDLPEYKGVGQLHKTLKTFASPGHEKEIWLACNKVGNFLKHADSNGVASSVT